MKLFFLCFICERQIIEPKEDIKPAKLNIQSELSNSVNRLVLCTVHISQMHLKSSHLLLKTAICNVLYTQ